MQNVYIKRNSFGLVLKLVFSLSNKQSLVFKIEFNYVNSLCP